MNKVRIVLVALLFGFTGLMLKAQDLPFVKADSLTYQYYLAKNWDRLLQVGDKAINNGYDYYYLRMRMGIAAYEKANYVLSRKHLQAALQFNPNDPEALRYLVAGRLLRNQLSQAGAETTAKPYYLQKSVFPNTGFQFQSVHFDAGLQQFAENQNTFEKLAGSDSYFGTESVPQNRSFFDGGLKFQTKPNLFVYVGFQSLTIPFVDRFAYVESTLEIDSVAIQDWGKEFYYRLDSTHIIQEFGRTVAQNVLYAQFDWAPSAKLQLIFSGQLILIRQQMNSIVLDPVMLRDTTYTVYETGETGFIDVPAEEASFSTFRANSKEWSLYTGMVYDVDYVSIIGGIAASRINKQQIWQLNAGLSYFPVGNLNLYGSTELNLLQYGSFNNLIVKQTIGFRPLKSFWIEGVLHAGNQSYYSDQTSYIVYNSTENVRLRTSLNTYVMLGEHFSVQLRYTYAKGDRPFSSYLPSTEENKTNYTSFQSTRITGGVKWTF